MFSIQQKRDIADSVQQILRNTNHPELPKGEIQFMLYVIGAESWSWAYIQNNGAVNNPTVNLHNEAVAEEMKFASSTATAQTQAVIDEVNYQHETPISAHEGKFGGAGASGSWSDSSSSDSSSSSSSDSSSSSSSGD